MRIFQLITFSAMVFCGSACTGERAKEVELFSRLKEGETMSVRYDSHGCFHRTKHELTFNRGSALAVKIVQIGGDKPGRMAGAQTNRLELGTLTLSESDVAGLDKLLKFYRTKRDDSCTTVESITLIQQRGGATVASNEFIDASCEAHRKTGLTRFGDLIARVKPPGR